MVNEIEQQDRVGQLKSQTYYSAVDSFKGMLPEVQDVEPSVLFADAVLAQEKDASRRTEYEAGVLRLSQTIVAVQGAIEKGLVKSPIEVSALTESLIWGSIKPSRAISYLSGPGNSNLTRALSPLELASAINIRGELISPSIATIVLAAEQAGVTLDGTKDVDDEDLHLICACIEECSWIGGRKIARYTENPDDGGVDRLVRTVAVSGTTIRNLVGSVTILNDEDALTGHRRAEEYLETTGADEEDFYYPTED